MLIKKNILPTMRHISDVAPNCKTVDELVEASIQTPSYTFESDYDACEFVVIYYSDTLLRILKSKINPPSKWDLMIIDCINKNNMDRSKILEVYKSRK